MKVENAVFDQGFVGGEIGGYRFRAQLGSDYNLRTITNSQIKSLVVFDENSQVVAQFEGDPDWFPVEELGWMTEPTGKVKKVVDKIVTFVKKHGVLN